MRKTWMALVVGALLLGTMVGVVWARPNDRPGGAATTRKITLVGADFVPAGNSADYIIGGIPVSCVDSACSFEAPVAFPCLSAVTVERFKLHVIDSNDGKQAAATLYRGSLSTGLSAYLGYASSPVGIGSGLQAYASPDINKVVWPSQKAYIDLWIEAPGIFVYGVTVEYHVNS